MKKMLSYTPLALAVLGALSTTAFADTSDLGTLQVTTDRQGAKVKSNVVTSAVKDESVETDLRGLFKDEPAIGIGGGNGTSQFIYIRNMGQNSVDVKVDNAYTDSQIHYHQGRHMLDPAMVKIVSVQKGAGSASAGIGQTNGAIIAKTLDADDLLKGSQKNFGAKVGAGYNSNNGYNVNASVFGKTGIVDFVAAINRVDEKNYKAGDGYVKDLRSVNPAIKKINPIEPLNTDGIVPFSALQKTSYLAKVGTTLDNHRLSLSHLQESHKGIRTVRQEFTAFASGGIPVARQAPTNVEMRVKNTNLEWDADNLGMVSHANANAYWLQHERLSADDSGNGYAGGNRNSGATKMSIDTKGANLNLDSHINDQTTLKYGLNYRTQEISPNAIFLAGLTKQKKQDIGAYAEVIADVGDLTATAGMRYDTFKFTAMDGKTVSKADLNPSLGLIYQATPNLSLSATHNYATRSPRLHDAIMAHGGRSIVSISDTTKAEQAKNTELGFNLTSFDVAGAKVSLDGSYFWQRINNALSTSTGRNNHLCANDKDGKPTNCYTEIINAGTIKNQGYELNASVRAGNVTGRFGVAHSTPKFDSVIVKAPNREGKLEDRALLSTNPEYATLAGRTWTGSLAYRFSPNLELGARHRYVEKAEGSLLLVGGGTATRRPYHVSDVFATYKPYANDRFNINFAVNNVANTFYYPHAQRGDTLPAAGREFRVGANYQF